MSGEVVIVSARGNIPKVALAYLDVDRGTHTSHRHRRGSEQATRAAPSLGNCRHS